MKFFKKIIKKNVFLHIKSNYKTTKLSKEGNSHKEQLNQINQINQLERLNFIPNLINSFQKKNLSNNQFQILNRLNEKLSSSSIKEENTVSSQQSFLIFHLIEILDESHYNKADDLIDYILNNKLQSKNSIDKAVEYIKRIGINEFDKEDFEKRLGINNKYDLTDIKAYIISIINENYEDILLTRYKYQWSDILNKVMKKYELADKKTVINMITYEISLLIGEKSDLEVKEDELRKELDEVKRILKKLLNSSQNKNSQNENEEIVKYTQKKELINNELKQISTVHFKKTPFESETDKLFKLFAREMTSSLNSKRLIEQHLQFTKGKVYTRFPPEPNGYLHIGHAKAIRFNFLSAMRNNGFTYLRYDDTNPEKESEEYINSIKENLDWLGYSPFKTTFASDYFDELYKFAVMLINKGKAYVCELSKERIKSDRVNNLNSPYRERSVEENLKLFTDMKNGLFQENQACLRLKINMSHENTTLRDPVIYRIKYSPHPRTGNKWVIYPLYDFTHCISDSLENITHSLCTLEFEIRRDIYYWILEELDLYRPYVWEYSRLNVSNTVLSKRKLNQLIEKKIVKGWDDPRLFTINGLRRRGITSNAINEFIDKVGVTRRGNENIVDIRLFENVVKTELDSICKRTMSVINPLLIILTNINLNEIIDVPLFPKNESKGKRKICLSNRIFIEKNDFSLVENEDFYGLTPNQHVGLKYSGYIVYDKVNYDENGNIISVECKYYSDYKKTKGRIHWISQEDSVECEVRLYENLLNSESVSKEDDWILDINPNSEIIIKNCKVEKGIINCNLLKPYDRFQFERLGYFVVDSNSNFEMRKIVFNRIVKL